MTNQKIRITWKAIVAMVLIVATLVAMSALVGAGFVEYIFGGEIVAMTGTTGGSGATCPSCGNTGCDSHCGDNCCCGKVQNECDGCQNVWCSDCN